MQSARAQGDAHTKSRFALRAAFSSLSLLTFSLTLAAGGSARVSTRRLFSARAAAVPHRCAGSNVKLSGTASSCTTYSS